MVARALAHGVVEQRDWAWVRADIATPDGDDRPPEMLFVCGANTLVEKVFHPSVRTVSARMYIGYGM